MLAKIKSFIATQLGDPTNILHAQGCIIIAGEVIHHWISKVPADVGTIGAGMGCFTVGGVIDHFQKKDGE